MTKFHLSRYMLDLPCIKTFTKAQWRALPRKEKRQYVSANELKNYLK